MAGQFVFYSIKGKIIDIRTPAGRLLPAVKLCGHARKQRKREP
jgi:hypothetical protein